MKRQLVAILYADVVGYSRMTGENEESTYVKLRASLNLLTEFIESAEGRKVNEAGDAILAEFQSIVAATNAAITFQLAMKEQNFARAESEQIKFRIGVNLGEVIHDRGDIFGDGVNVAARVQSLANPGGVTTTAAVRDQVNRKIAYEFVDMGEKKLKNIVQPVRVFSVRIDDAEKHVHPAEFLIEKDIENPLLDFDGSPIEEPPHLTGGCLCGDVRYEISGKPVGTGMCHCRLCQRALGAPVNAWIVFKDKDIRFLNSKPRYFKSSVIAERSFCPNCGTSLTYRLVKPERSEYQVFCLPTLDDPSAFQPS